jgi:hypothetical protein
VPEAAPRYNTRVPGAYIYINKLSAITAPQFLLAKKHIELKQIELTKSTYNPDVVNTTKHNSSQLQTEGVPHSVFNLCSIIILQCPNNQTVEINQFYSQKSQWMSFKPMSLQLFRAIPYHKNGKEK